MLAAHEQRGRHMQDLELERTWLDDHTEHRPRHTRAMLIAGLTVPWVVVAAVLVAMRPPSAPPADAAAPAPAATPGPHAHAHDHPVEPLVDAVQVQGAWRASTGPAAAGAVATVHAHDWLVARPGTATTVDVLAVEGVEQLDGDVAVVTVLGAVRRDGEATRVRLGVPVRTRGVVPDAAGEPWHLPMPPRDHSPLVGVPVDDPTELLAASEALVEAGYVDVSVVTLERTDAWPWRVHARARTPDGRTVDTPVLLRRHLDGFVVAGTVHPGTGR